MVSLMGAALLGREGDWLAVDMAEHHPIDR